MDDLLLLHSLLQALQPWKRPERTVELQASDVMLKLEPSATRDSLDLPSRIPNLIIKDNGHADLGSIDAWRARMRILDLICGVTSSVQCQCFAPNPAVNHNAACATSTASKCESETKEGDHCVSSFTHLITSVDVSDRIGALLAARARSSAPGTSPVSIADDVRSIASSPKGITRS